MDARIFEITEAVANLINAEWTDKGANDAVTADEIFPNLDVDDMTGRKVYVLEAGYGQVEQLDRKSDLNEYTVNVVVVEKCTDQNGPTKSWLKTRVNFVQDQIYDRLNNHRDEPILEDLMPDSGEVTLYDWAFLKVEGVFISEVIFTFRRVESI